MILDELKQYKPYSISPGYNAQNIIYGVFKDQMIEGTSYFEQTDNHKAMKGLVHSHIDLDFIYYYTNENSILWTIERHHEKKAYLEYSINDQRLICVLIDSDTDCIYRLLLCAGIYLYNQYQIELFKDIYMSWRQINMNEHEQADQWDANEYTLVCQIADQLVKILNSIISDPQSFMYLYYDSVCELMEHLHIHFNTQSLTYDYLFQKDISLLIDLEKEKAMIKKTSKDYIIDDIHSLYNDEEKKKLPLFLQESIKDNEALYMHNREFLDMNDFDLIKSFKRGKTWSCLYYGPSGTGKTTKILCVAGALGLPAMKLVGSRSIDESTLFGKYVLRNGETVFEYGPLSLMMKYGGMFVFDEINMVDSDIISSLNDVLDGTKQKILDNGEIIHAHPYFRFAESMNIGYAGTNEMNISHKSRIQTKIKLSQLPIDKMRDIIVKETDIDVSIAYKMASLLDAFTNIILSEGNETTQRIDLRTLINWAHKTVDLDGDVLRASLTTIISELAEEDDEIMNLEDIEQIMRTHGACGSIMNLIVHEMSDDDVK